MQTSSFSKDLKNGNVSNCFRKIYDEIVGINDPVENGKYPLHIICDSAKDSKSPEKKYIYVKYVYLAYDLLRHRSDLSVTDQEGKTPLHYASLYGLHRFIELFHRFNVDLSAKDDQGNTALHLVAINGNLIALALLLKIVHKTCPSVLLLKNNNGKCFNDLFESSDQILIFNRFKDLNNISKPRNPKSQNELLTFKGKLDRRRGTFPEIFYAMIALDDVELIEKIIKPFRDKWYLNDIIEEDDIIYENSSKMAQLLRNTFLCDRSSVITNIPYIRDSLFSIADLLDDAGEGNNFLFHEIFSSFNYSCTVASHAQVKKVTREMVNNRIILRKDDLKILKKFYPELASEYFQSIGFIFVDNETKLGEDSCPICREPYEIGDICSKLSCKHIFHKDCLIAWKPYQSTCPMCRRKVKLPLLNDHLF